MQPLTEAIMDLSKFIIGTIIMWVAIISIAILSQKFWQYLIHVRAREMAHRAQLTTPTTETDPSRANQPEISHNTDGSLIENFNQSYINAGNNAIKLPQLWEAEIGLWFGCVEAQFRSADFTSPHGKYDAIIRALNIEQLKRVEEVVVTRPIINPYDVLKNALCQAFEIPISRKLELFLNQDLILNEKPTDLLSKLKKLSGRDLSKDSAFQPLLKRMFLNKLPTSVQQILTADLDSSVEILAKRADNIMALPENKSKPDITTVIDSPQTTINELLERKISNLSQNIDKISIAASYRAPTVDNQSSFSSGYRSQNGKFNPNKPGTFHNRDHHQPFKSNERNGLCYYHHTFGKKAFNCRAPCKWEEAKNE